MAGEDKMAKCSFCGSMFEKGTGKMIIQKTGKINYYCSSKCEKNARLGRDPRNLKWVVKKK